MYVITNELYHHGVKGQRWGVRRERNRFDYRQSNAYKNGTGEQRRIQTNQYNANRRFMGRKAANRIEYDVNNGKDRKKVSRREGIKAGIKWAAGITAATVAVATLPKAAQWYKTQRNLLQLNNLATDLASQTLGLNEVKGGFTSGIKQVKNGKKIYDAISGL